MATTSSNVAERKIVVDVGTLSGAELNLVVDEDIAKFDEVFQTELGNSPLVPSERAAIKTWIWFKIHRDNK